MEKIDERSLTISELKKILEQIGEENLSQFQRRNLEYARKFARLEPEKAAELVEKLVKSFDITEEEAVQIVDCMPRSPEEARIFLVASRKKILLISQLKEIIKLLDEYRK
jgi:DNA-directed RNA polymerase subunit F